MNADEFWTLPRSTPPARVFGELAERLPVPLPKATLTRGVAVHVRGTGGGTWSGRLVDGALQMQVGACQGAICHVVLERSTLRELVAGSLRDRGLQIMERLGKPRALPNLSRLPVRNDRADALARLSGSVALDIADRGFGEVHRVVLGFGDAEPDFDRATVTIRVDADEAVGWIASRTDLGALLRGGRLRVEGDLTLLTRALALLLDP